MADRVAFIGGSTAGRDHLPWNVSLAVDWAPAIVTNDENFPIDVEMANGRGDGYIFPFGFGATDFLKYALRVRKWHFAFTATIQKSVEISPAPDNPPFYEWQEGSANISFDYQFAVVGHAGGIIPSRDAHSVLSPEFRYVTFNLFDDGTNSSNDRGGSSASPFPQIDNISTSHTAGFIAPGATNALSVFLRQDIRFDQDPFQVGFITGGGYGGWIDGQWWPRIQLTVANSGGSFCRSAWRGLYDSPETKGALSLFGSNVSIKADPLGLADDNAGGLSFSALDVEITPVEFWPFATKSGQDVYDTATGAQLRDPLS